MARTYSTVLGTVKAENVEGTYIITDSNGTKIGEVCKNKNKWRACPLGAAAENKETLREACDLLARVAEIRRESEQRMAAYFAAVEAEATAADKEEEAEDTYFDDSAEIETEEEREERENREWEEERDRMQRECDERRDAEEEGEARRAATERNQREYSRYEYEAAAFNEEEEEATEREARKETFRAEVAEMDKKFEKPYQQGVCLEKWCAADILPISSEKRIGCFSLSDKEKKEIRQIEAQSLAADDALRQQAEREWYGSKAQAEQPPTIIVETIGIRATELASSRPPQLKIEIDIVPHGVYIYTTVLRHSEQDGDILFYTGIAVCVETWKGVNAADIFPAWYPILAAHGTPRIDNPNATPEEIAAFWVGHIEAFCQMWQRLADLLHAAFHRTSIAA